MNNDAFKHCGGENNNEKWTQLLRDLKFFEDVDDHTMYLRRRFVFGAAELMAGKNESKQNDKLLFDYTDSEWEYIWSTMLVDGAWAVPSIKDNEGNTTKANFAPEILIKFIAHDLKCHIIVFDLLLNRIQFLSGNHVKSNNVVFDSPLLIYSTGGHFQSIFQTDHEYFVNYAEQLEAENDLSERGQFSMNPIQASQPKETPKSCFDDLAFEGQSKDQSKKSDLIVSKHKQTDISKRNTRSRTQEQGLKSKKQKLVRDCQSETKTKFVALNDSDSDPS